MESGKTEDSKAIEIRDEDDGVTLMIMMSGGRTWHSSLVRRLSFRLGVSRLRTWRRALSVPGASYS